MKEFPKFIWNNKDYDLCFYDDSIQLYGVVNVLSGVMVSQLIPAANDYVAITGFKNFVDSQKEKNDSEIYQLVCLGTLSIEKVEIVDSHKLELISSRDDLEDFINKARDFMISFNDED